LLVYIVAAWLSPLSLILLCDVTNPIRDHDEPSLSAQQAVAADASGLMVRSRQRNHFGFVGARILHDSIA
jgi:hypothetical protein